MYRGSKRHVNDLVPFEIEPGDLVVFARGMYDDDDENQKIVGIALCTLCTGQTRGLLIPKLPVEADRYSKTTKVIVGVMWSGLIT
jgi:hypothetical protein